MPDLLREWFSVWNAEAHCAKCVSSISDTLRGKCCCSQSITGGLHVELTLALGIVRAAIDVLTIMGDATLAVSAVVLGASMFQKRSMADTAPQSSIQTGAARPMMLSGDKLSGRSCRNGRNFMQAEE